ncbi:MAG: zinc ribbon domain-containing protein [Candidatus Heimdallarchaeota archaeon]|nr:zinc ribbon domain-containing protein [Candidatus Heimdallarchaeota archaeon]
MVHYHRSHHDSNSSNYLSHVLTIGKLDYCLGCLGSKLFLITTLPLLLALFVYPNSLISVMVDWTIIGLLWVMTTASFAYELIKKRDVKSRFLLAINNLYLIGSISYVVLVPSKINSRYTILLSLILAVPQIGVYLHKSVTQKEFTHKKAKFFIRLLFIIAFFFAIANFNENFYLKLVILSMGILVFSRLRTFSDLRVNSDKFLFSSIPFSDNSLLSKFLKKLKIFDSNGSVKGLNSASSLISKIYFIIIISILYFFGLVIIGSNLPTLAACSNTVYTTTMSVPSWIIMKSSNQKFCANCGTASPMDYRFCDNCGSEFHLVTPDQQSQPQSQHPPQRGQYQQTQPYNQGYQPYSGQGHRREDKSKSIPIGVSIAVGLVVLLMTGNIIFAIIMGVVAYFGTIFAMSTNNPCLGYCVMRTCMDCICSATMGERRRGGKF